MTAAESTAHCKMRGRTCILTRSWLHMQAAGMPPQYSRSWVETLNEDGFSVCGIDQQGCGFSEGLECYVERFHYYVDDVLQFARCETPLNSLSPHKGISVMQP